MIYVDIRHSDGYNGVRNSSLVFGYSRVPTPSTSTRKAVLAAVIAVAAFVGYVALSATDVPDHKPTAVLYGGGR